MSNAPNPRRDKPYTAATLKKYIGTTPEIIFAMEDQGLIEPFDKAHGVKRYLLGDVLDAKRFYKRKNTRSAGVTWRADGTPVSITVMCMDCNTHFMPHQVNTRRLCNGCAAKHQLKRAGSLAEAEGK